jgi:hypothetical protein
MHGGLRIGAAALGALLALWPAAPAAQADSASQSFTTAGEHAFVVPPGVTSLQVALVGGYGGTGSAGTPGGIPASAGATLSVSPGETLYAEVAGDGESATGLNDLGGYDGGGNGGTDLLLFASHPGGGGGGGASDVRLCATSAVPAECGGRSSLASRLLVAAGGGGGGGNGLSPPSTAGGNGGASDQPGSAGAHDAYTDAGGGGGSRASATTGGAAGASGVCEPVSDQNCAAKGELGSGGSGGEDAAGSGGGGGGGIFGGGGGGAGELSNIGTPESPNLAAGGGGGGGGGGGSSGVVAGAAGVSAFSLVPTAEGALPAVTFTWTAPAPAVVTGAASAVTATTATLNGSVDPNAWQIVSCGFDISPAPAGVSSFPCAQQLTASGTPTPVSATAAGLTPGTTYTVTLAAANTQGASAGAPITFATPPANPGTGPAGTGPLQTLTVTNLRLAPARFRRGGRAASIAKRKPGAAPTSTTISFGLSASASVRLGFEARRTGVLANRRCIAASKSHRRGKRCVRYVPVSGDVLLPASAGTDRISFDGVLSGGKRLSPGSYRLSLTATAGSASTQAAQHPTFTLLA